MATILRPPLIIKIWRAERSVELLSWVQGFNLVLQPIEEAEEFVFRAPIEGRLDEPDRSASLNSQSITQSPLRFITPHSQNNWPVPSQQFRSIVLITWLQGFNPLLQPVEEAEEFVFRAPIEGRLGPPDRSAALHSQSLGQAALRFAAPAVPHRQTEWPNPKGAQASISLRTWIDQVKLNLRGQDRFFGLAGHPNYDWPNPRGPGRVAHTWIGGFRIQDQAAQFPPIAINYDWPNPRGPIPAIVLRSWIDQTKRHLIGRDKFFGLAGHPNYDWPVPRGPGRVAHSWASGFRVQDQALQVPPAAINYDWPNPRGYIPSVALKTWVDQTKRLLIGKDKFFGAPGMGPHYDYPNPRGYIPNIELKTWIDQTKRHLIAQDKFFGLAGHPNYDWPNPRGYIPSIALRTWAIAHPLGITIPPIVREPSHRTRSENLSTAQRTDVIMPRRPASLSTGIRKNLDE